MLSGKLVEPLEGGDSQKTKWAPEEGPVGLVSQPYLCSLLAPDWAYEVTDAKSSSP